jgi:hypothetical protein
MTSTTPGYIDAMPGDNDGLTPDAAPVEGSDEHTRIQDKRRFSGDPEIEGVPDEEGIEGTDLEERLDEDPDEQPNRRDVPGA